MSATKREKELARQRAERQAARRAALAARRRQRNAVLGSVLAVLLVAGGVGALALTRGGDGGTATVAQPVPSGSAAAGGQDATGSTPSPASAAGASSGGPCSYPSAGDAARKVEKPPTEGVETTGVFVATMRTNRGTVVFEMDAAKAPCTTNNLRSLAHFSYFDKTPCHRLVTSGIFVLQCGDPTGKGTGGPGYRFADENLQGATYPRGTVAMANSGPGTNGSQFFLVYQDSQLSADYTPFGRIVSGLDVLDRIGDAGAEPSPDGAPRASVTIETLRTARKR